MVSARLNPVAVKLQDEELIADPSGALYWPREKTLVVADLHFEKGSSFARRGIFLPPYDTHATLIALEKALAKFSPRRVVSLGDGFHDQEGAERLSERERDTLCALMRARDWIWVLGNHDPKPPKELGGTSAEELTIGALAFRHEPAPGAPTGEIAGHLHPCASVSARGRRLRRRCFAIDASRIVMPAFGAYAGGLCVLDSAFALLLRAPFTAMLLGRERVYPVSHARLLPDAA